MTKPALTEEELLLPSVVNERLGTLAMIPDSALPTLRVTCRTLQIIVLALATGVCVFAVIAVVKTKGRLTWEFPPALTATPAATRSKPADNDLGGMVLQAAAGPETGVSAFVPSTSKVAVTSTCKPQ